MPMPGTGAPADHRHGRRSILTELLQLLERNWGAGDERVVAGLSMGGFGAMGYAARHPGMFRAAASYSGVLDTIDPGSVQRRGHVRGPGRAGRQLDGPQPARSRTEAQGHPAVRLVWRWPARSARPGGHARHRPRNWIAPQNDAFVARLGELGIPATVDAYGPGTHDWPYWERALHRSLPMLLEALGEDPSVPPRHRGCPQPR